MTKEPSNKYPYWYIASLKTRLYHNLLVRCGLWAPFRPQQMCLGSRSPRYAVCMAHRHVYTSRHCSNTIPIYGKTVQGRKYSLALVGMSFQGVNPNTKYVVEFRRRPDINLVDFTAAPAGTILISVPIIWLSWCDDRLNFYGLYL